MNPAHYQLNHDELARHRARVFEALSNHSDPLLREMGRQLAGGALTPYELITTPHYADAVLNGVGSVDTMVGRDRTMTGLTPDVAAELPPDDPDVPPGP